MSQQNQVECRHTNLRKEYMLGAQTGDFECLDCGRMGYGRDWPEKQRAEKVKKLWEQHNELSAKAKTLGEEIVALDAQENLSEHFRLVKESTETYQELSQIIRKINELMGK